MVKSFLHSYYHDTDIKDSICGEHPTKISMEGCSDPLQALETYGFSGSEIPSPKPVRDYQDPYKIVSLGSKRKVDYERHDNKAKEMEAKERAIAKIKSDREKKQIERQQLYNIEACNFAKEQLENVSDKTVVELTDAICKVRLRLHSGSYLDDTVHYVSNLINRAQVEMDSKITEASFYTACLVSRGIISKSDQQKLKKFILGFPNTTTAKKHIKVENSLVYIDTNWNNDEDPDYKLITRFL